jgi:hypothetical protein
LTVNYYTSQNFDEIGKRFKKISDEDLKKTLREYKNTFLSVSSLMRLGLDDEAVGLFKFIDGILNSESSSKISEDLFDYIDIFVASELKSAKGENTSDPDDTDELKPIRTAQKTHYACGLVKYIYELNQMRQIASGASTSGISNKVVTDSSKQDWQRSSVSFTGIHTHGVNSDAVLKKKHPRILAAVADGVSIPSICPTEDKHDHWANQYSSATASKAVIEGLENFSPSVTIAQRSIDNDTKNKILDNIFQFLIFLRIIFNNSYPREKIRNLEDLVKKFREDTSLQSSFKEECRIDNLLDILNDKTVTQHLALAEAVLQSQQGLKNIFQTTHPHIKLSAGTTLSFAMDLGDQIGFVHIGDSPILVFDNNGKLIKSTSINESNVINNCICVARSEENSTVKVAYTKLDPSNVFIIDKNKVGGFLIMSDGAIAKGTQAQDFSSSVINNDLENCLPRILKKITSQEELDDTSVQLVVKNKNPSSQRIFAFIVSLFRLLRPSN